MLYAFFDAEGRLRREAFSRQIAAAHGLRRLGHRRAWAWHRGRRSSGATERRAGGRMGDRRRRRPRAGRRDRGRRQHARHDRERPLCPRCRRGVADPAAAAAAGLGRRPHQLFRRRAETVDCPVGIQNAPEFLGIGLSPADLLALNAAHRTSRWSRPKAPPSRWRRGRGDRRPHESLQRPRRARTARQFPRRRRRHDPRHRNHRPAGRRRAGDARRRRGQGRSALRKDAAGAHLHDAGARAFPALRQARSPRTGSASRRAAIAFPPTAPARGLDWARRFAAELGPLPT